MSLALSVTSVISTGVSSIFSAVIRPWGMDSAKPHLPPAFLENVKIQSSHLSSDDKTVVQFDTEVRQCDVTAHLAFLSFSRALLMSSVISDTLTLAILLHLITFNTHTIKINW